MILYRAIINNTHEHFDDPNLAMYYQEHEIIRTTNCFYIIKINNKDRKIGINSKNAFAAPTKEKAFMDLWHRNRMHLSILKSRLSYATKVRDFIREQIKKD